MAKNNKTNCNIKDIEKKMLLGTYFIMGETLVWTLISYNCFLLKEKKMCSCAVQLWPIHVGIVSFFSLYVFRFLVIYLHLRNKYEMGTHDNVDNNNQKIIPLSSTVEEWESV